MRRKNSSSRSVCSPSYLSWNSYVDIFVDFFHYTILQANHRVLAESQEALNIFVFVFLSLENV